MIKLNTVGRKRVKEIKKQMEDLGIYEDGDDKILLFDIGYQYQLYIKSLEEIEAIVEPESGLLMKADRYYKNYINSIHKLGLTPMARKAMKAQRDPNKNKDNSDSIFSE